ncbi:MAG: hypothetical protein ACYDHY_18115 [Acidiferrobacterales bacterium]
MPKTTLLLCTMTGVDEATDLNRLAALSVCFPFAEWGFLFSPSRQGTGGRYPSVDFINRAMVTVPRSTKVALHLCGRAVDDFIAGKGDARFLAEAVGNRRGRLQVNVNLAKQPDITPRILDAAIDRFPGTVILQHNDANEPAAVHLAASNRAFLFDRSGGRGVTPAQWPQAIPGVRCGFAGGLGPESLGTELPRIDQASAGDSFWVDMESRLRDGNDRFDLERATRALEAVEKFLERDSLKLAC